MTKSAKENIVGKKDIGKKSEREERQKERSDRKREKKERVLACVSFEIFRGRIFQAKNFLKSKL